MLRCIFSSQQVVLCFTHNGRLLESAGVPVCHPGPVAQRWARIPSRQEETGTDLSRWRQHPAAPPSRSTGPPLQQGPRRARGPGGPCRQGRSRAALPQAPAPPGQARGWRDGPGEFEPSETRDGPGQGQRQSYNGYEGFVPGQGKRPSGDTKRKGTWTREWAWTPFWAQETRESSWQGAAWKRWATGSRHAEYRACSRLV